MGVDPDVELQELDLLGDAPRAEHVHAEADAQALEVEDEAREAEAVLREGVEAEEQQLPSHGGHADEAHAGAPELQVRVGPAVRRVLEPRGPDPDPLPDPVEGPRQASTLR